MSNWSLGWVSIQSCLLAAPVYLLPVLGRERDVWCGGLLGSFLIVADYFLNDIKTWCYMVSLFRLDFTLQPPYLSMRLILFVVAEGLLKSTKQADGWKPSCWFRWMVGVCLCVDQALLLGLSHTAPADQRGLARRSWRSTVLWRHARNNGCSQSTRGHMLGFLISAWNWNKCK